MRLLTRWPSAAVGDGRVSETVRVEVDGDCGERLTAESRVIHRGSSVSGATLIFPMIPARGPALDMVQGDRDTRAEAAIRGRSSLTYGRDGLRSTRTAHSFYTHTHTQPA